IGGESAASAYPLCSAAALYAPSASLGPVGGRSSAARASARPRRGFRGDRTSAPARTGTELRSEEHTSELSHQIISYAVFCLKKSNEREAYRSSEHTRAKRRDHTRTPDATASAPNADNLPGANAQEHHTPSGHTRDHARTTHDI